MQNLDYRVIQQAIDWLEQGHTIWLCTVLSTFGSSPRESGAMMVAKADGRILVHCRAAVWKRIFCIGW